MVTGLLVRSDGSHLFRNTIAGPAAEAARLGREPGDRLRREASTDILA
jgi:porphobilinogen deaminase